MMQRMSERRVFLVISLALILSVAGRFAAAEEPLRFSGRYPHLAVYNTGGESGIGALPPWAGRLWFITYSPHQASGSDDKLYELDDALNLTVRPASIGGTPANRMIHRESNQLFIGPYAIDADRHVRAIPYETMYGRHTATARHLSEPEQKVLYFDMEGLVYEVDVETLEVNLPYRRAVPGWHAKGAYTSQGRFVVANNGERGAGSLDRFRPFEYQIDPERTSPEEAVTVTVEVDVTASGAYWEYARFEVPPNESLTYHVPDGYAAHWVRLTADRDAKLTATFLYE